MALGKSLARSHPALRFTRQVAVWIILSYLRLFARLSLSRTHATIIGIGGAVGKSTIRNALAAILASEKITHVVSGNSETGIPLGLLGLDIGTYSLSDWIRVMLHAPFSIGKLQHTQYLIVEMGIDGPEPPKNMAYLLSIVRPNIAILVNESPVHLEKYETVLSAGDLTQPLSDQIKIITEYIARDDAKMLQHPGLQTAVINADDPILSSLTRALPQGRLLTIGQEIAHDVSLRGYDTNDDQTFFSFLVRTHQINDTINITLPRIGLPEETGYTIGAAILTAVHLGIPPETIEQNLHRYFLVPPGRASLFDAQEESSLIDSSYNASSASVHSFLSLLSYRKKQEKRPTVFLFGDMRELGRFSEYEHKQIAKELPGLVDHLVLVGHLTKEFVLPYAQKHQSKFKSLVWFPNSLEAGNYLSDHLPKKSIMLVKGSQLLEEAVKYVLIHHEDEARLCRQDTFWKTVKQKQRIWG